MTCAPTAATFRLLDDVVGWDQDRDTVRGLVFGKPGGVRLANAGSAPEGPTRAQLLPWFPGPRLAPGCLPCGWYLIAGRRLLRRDTCGGAFRPVWPPHCDPGVPHHPDAIAARGHRLAAVGDDRVYVWRNDGDHLVAVIHLAGARLVALAPDEQVLVVAGTEIHRYGPDGCLRGTWCPAVTGTITGIRTGAGRTVWLLTEDDDGVPRIYRDGTASTLDELAAEVPPSTLVAADEHGFCLRENSQDGVVTSCYTWSGAPMPEPPPPGGQYVGAGEFTTTPIPSGISRCRWHRVRVTADVPEGTSVTVAVVVSEDGRFADSDWQTAPAGVTDFLVDQPPGQFITVRVGFTGDTSNTPVLHRIRLDFPRTTSADLLPAAFRQDPVADDFTERFLSLFDATFTEIDQVIERYPALLDPEGVPDRALPWLAGLLGLTFESGWDATTRRALLAAAPGLYRRRGTPWALKKAVEIVFGVEPVLHELADDRHWAQVRATARPGGALGLGAVRLFGRSATRFRVSGSALGAAPLRAFGDPDTDPLTEHAHRFRVLVPAGQVDEAALARVVARQAPAHTRASVHTGGAGFVVGTRSAVGVDTAFVPLKPPVVGGTRLNHDGVLRPGPGGARHGVSVGVVSAVGIHTQVS